MYTSNSKFLWRPGSQDKLTAFLSEMQTFGQRSGRREDDITEIDITESDIT